MAGDGQCDNRTTLPRWPAAVNASKELPRQGADLTLKKAHTTQPIGSAERQVAPRRSALNVTVLVVDDSKTVRQSASGFLAAQGYSVVTACDGFDALAKVVECRPSVVFADIMMPRLDGYQTCALIKNNAEYRHTSVIMLSSKDGLFDRARGRIVGADAHLSKPFTRDHLIASVEEQLSRASLRTENSSANGPAPTLSGTDSKERRVSSSTIDS